MEKVIEKILESKCYKCAGIGAVFSDEKGDYFACPTCDGTGIYKEIFYYFIDEKNKIAFSGDTLK